MVKLQPWRFKRRLTKMRVLLFEALSPVGESLGKTTQTERSSHLDHSAGSWNSRRLAVINTKQRSSCAREDQSHSKGSRTTFWISWSCSFCTSWRSLQENLALECLFEESQVIKMSSTHLEESMSIGTGDFSMPGTCFWIFLTIPLGLRNMSCFGADIRWNVRPSKSTRVVCLIWIIENLKPIFSGFFPVVFPQKSRSGIHNWIANVPWDGYGSTLW